MKGRIGGVALMALALVSAVLIAGCGGGEETADATETLTKAEFIKQGDAICKKALQQNGKEVNEFAEENDFTFASASERQLEELVTQILVPKLNQQAEELGALGAPEGDEQQVEEIIVSLEDATDEIEGDPGSVFKGNSFKEPGKLTKAYGFKICGQE